VQLWAAAAGMAGIVVLIAWIALAHQKALWELWFFFAVVGAGAVAFAAAAFYFGARHVEISETALGEKRPFKSPVRIAWSEVTEVTRFEFAKETDICTVGGTPAITIHDQIDRFAELQALLVDKAAARYRTLRRRPTALPRWTVPALLAALFFGLAAWDWLAQGRIKVTVVDPEGVPVPSAEVFFYNKQHPQPQDKVDAAGFVQRRLPAAAYYLSVSSRGFDPYYRRIEVRMLTTEELRVTLERPVF
jgi:hypothetical protein